MSRRRPRKVYGPGKASLRYLEEPTKDPSKLARSAAGEILRCAKCGVFPVELETHQCFLFQCPVCPAPMQPKWGPTREAACEIWNQRQALTRNPRPGRDGRNRMRGKML